MDTKINQVRQKKEQIVAKIAEKVSRAKGIIFANYQGMTHKQLEDLKKELRKSDAELVVTKNTLLKIALSKSNEMKASVEDPKAFQGATATLFSFSDVISPIKALAKAIKAINLPEIKFGFLEGRMLTKEDVMKLSTLPTKEILLAQIVGGIKAPIFGLHRALNWNIQKFVLTLNAVKQKKTS